MDNLGDLLYIVLLIVAGVSSILSSAKKKKKRPTQVLGQPGMEDRVPEVKTEGKSFWEMLEDINEPVNTVEPAPAPAPKSERKQKKTVFPGQLSTRERKERAIQQASEKRTAFSSTIDRSPITSSVKSSFTERTIPIEETPLVTHESFDKIEEVRKAIIYTEILNRKY